MLPESFALIFRGVETIPGLPLPNPLIAKTQYCWTLAAPLDNDVETSHQRIDGSTASCIKKDVTGLTAAPLSGLNNPSFTERIADQEAPHEQPECCGSFSFGAQPAQP